MIFCNYKIDEDLLRKKIWAINPDIILMSEDTMKLLIKQNETLIYEFYCDKITDVKVYCGIPIYRDNRLKIGEIKFYKEEKI